MKIYFNDAGYYITDEPNIEIYMSCQPALSNHGERLFDPLYHLYAVLIRALEEVKSLEISKNITIYNDTRLIDELNGHISPLDDNCQHYNNIVKLRLIPEMPNLVFFEKKSSHFIKKNLKCLNQN
jgi:hypothetical protein